MYKDKEFQENVMRISILLKAKEGTEILQNNRSNTYGFM